MEVILIKLSQFNKKFDDFIRRRSNLNLFFLKIHRINRETIDTGLNIFELIFLFIL